MIDKEEYGSISEVVENIVESIVDKGKFNGLGYTVLRVNTPAYIQKDYILASDKVSFAIKYTLDNVDHPTVDISLPIENRALFTSEFLITWNEEVGESLKDKVFGERVYNTIRVERRKAGQWTPSLIRVDPLSNLSLIGELSHDSH